MLNNLYGRNGGCACNNNSDSLKRRLQMVDFAMYDTVLYLDAYPKCQKAIAHYNKLLKERQALIEQLSSMGTPITNHNCTDGNTWIWTNGPWPWEHEAN